MTISNIAKHVLEHGAVLIRPRSVGEYDMKPLFTGNNHGWTVLDTQTANAINTVREALKDNAKVHLFDRIPLRKLVDFCWKHVH